MRGEVVGWYVANARAVVLTKFLPLRCRKRYCVEKWESYRQNRPILQRFKMTHEINVWVEWFCVEFIRAVRFPLTSLTYKQCVDLRMQPTLILLKISSGCAHCFAWVVCRFTRQSRLAADWMLPRKYQTPTHNRRRRADEAEILWLAQNVSYTFQVHLFAHWPWFSGLTLFTLLWRYQHYFIFWYIFLF